MEGREGEGRVREGRKGGEGTPVCIFKNHSAGEGMKSGQLILIVRF